MVNDVVAVLLVGVRPNMGGSIVMFAMVGSSVMAVACPALEVVGVVLSLMSRLDQRLVADVALRTVSVVSEFVSPTTAEGVLENVEVFVGSSAVVVDDDSGVTVTVVASQPHWLLPVLLLRTAATHRATVSDSAIVPPQGATV